MLGKLAKWLRMLGYDTVYIPDADDDELVRIAVREDRLLLTRAANLTGVSFLVSCRIVPTHCSAMATRG